MGMSSVLTKKLLIIYLAYKDDPNPPVPIDTIKEFLELEGEVLKELIN